MNVERLHPLTAAARGGVLLVVLIWRAIRSIEVTETGALEIPERGELVFLIVVAALYLFLTVVGGVLVVRNTRFWLADDAFHIERGWVTRVSDVVPFRRVDGVHVTRPLFGRLLGLAKVRIDAGEDASIELSYLSRTHAVELQERLTASRTADGVAEVSLDGVGDEPRPGQPGEREPLVAIDSKRLGRSRLRSLTPAGALVIVGIASVVISVLNRPILFFPLALVVAGALARWIWGIAQAGVAEVWVEDDRLIAKSGRFDLTSQSVPLRRVQSAMVSQSWLWRKPGWYSLTLTAVGAGADEDDGDTLEVLPVATEAELRLVLGAIWPGLDVDALLTRRLPERAKYAHPFNVRHLRWGYNRHFAAVRSGWLGRAWEVVALSRLQSVDLEAGPYGQRQSLASLNLRTLGSLGFTHISGLDKDEAMAAFDELTQISAKKVAP